MRTSQKIWMRARDKLKDHHVQFEVPGLVYGLPLKFTRSKIEGALLLMWASNTIQ